MNIKNDCLNFTFKRKSYNIKIEEIIYFETINRKIILHSINDTIEFNSTIKELENKFKECDFVRIHRAFIVNSKYINKIFKGEAILSNGERLIVGRNYNKKVRNFIDEYKANLNK
ncbi:LytTR family DNA-binding domain-containing protein [Anaerofustis sp.]|uniref:LytR/AlgR family response regulator transcription factor n=1 Tax=Anaerofustis sp. TaxID=1872517 RepID=UPI0025C03AC8|nr:LytTR family DNA-binding domain-containing protein [Anaerofustis sp.]